ncbi:unnamed protein product [Chrysoparadoxa australica]
MDVAATSALLKDGKEPQQEPEPREVAEMSQGSLAEPKAEAEDKDKNKDSKISTETAEQDCEPEAKMEPAPEPEAKVEPTSPGDTVLLWKGPDDLAPVTVPGVSRLAMPMPDELWQRGSPMLMGRGFSPASSASSNDDHVEGAASAPTTSGAAKAYARVATPRSTGIPLVHMPDAVHAHAAKGKCCCIS